MLLLAGAGLLIRSFSRLVDVSPGFQTQHLLTAELSLPEKAYPDGPPVQKFYAQLIGEPEDCTRNPVCRRRIGDAPHRFL